MSEQVASDTAANQAYAVVVDWIDPAQREADEDSPFRFGPYPTREAAQKAVDYVRSCKDFYDETKPCGMDGTIEPYPSDAGRCMSPESLAAFMSW